MRFEELNFVNHRLLRGKATARVDFDNGYAASIVDYGAGDGGYELAVMHSGLVCFDTPVGDDVAYEQTEEQIEQLLKDIKALPPRTK